jgi:uncharacterized protein (TIGR00295 family)
MVVRDMAVNIARRTNADLQLVEVGALLHDIGRAKTHGVMHAIAGAEIAEKLGLPRSICHIIERHVGAGIPQDEAVRLGLPPGEYVPVTMEEKIVAHADNLVDGNVCQPIEYEVERARSQGLDEYADRLVQLHRELSDRCGIDLNELCHKG